MRPVMKVLAVLVSLILDTVGGSPGTTTTSLIISGGGECRGCNITSNVTNNQDREIRVNVTRSGTYVEIETELMNPLLEPVVFVLRTDFSVKTWRIPSVQSRQSREYSARLLPTDTPNSNMKLIVSTKSAGKN